MGFDTQLSPEQTARHVRQSMPDDGLFDGHQWRIATRPFPLDKKIVRQLEQLGRVLLKFYQAANTIYNWSAEGQLPDWQASGLIVVSRSRSSIANATARSAPSCRASFAPTCC